MAACTARRSTVAASSPPESCSTSALVSVPMPCEPSIFTASSISCWRDMRKSLAPAAAVTHRSPWAGSKVSFVTPSSATISRCRSLSCWMTLHREGDRLDDVRLGDFVGAGLDHHDRVLGAGDDQVEVSRLDLLVGGERLELALDARDAHGGDGASERDLRHPEGDRCRRGAEDVGRNRAVRGEQRQDDLHLAAVALGEERPDRAVGHARGQRCLVAGAAFAAEEGAGDLANGVHPLFEVDGEREEVDAGAGIAVAHGCEEERVADADRCRPRPRSGRAARFRPRRSGLRCHGRTCGIGGSNAMPSWRVRCAMTASPSGRQYGLDVGVDA